MPVTHGVAGSSPVQTATKTTKRVDELVSSALLLHIDYLDQQDRINSRQQFKYLQTRFIPLLPDDSTWYSLSFHDIENVVFKLRSQGLKDSSISVMTRALRTLWNKRYKEGIAPLPPRFNFRLKTATIPEYLTRNEIEILFQNLHKYESVDIWILLYLFRGMNFKDLALLKKNQVVNQRVYYYRSKTGKEVPSFRVSSIASKIIDKYSNSNSLFLLPYLNEIIHVSNRSIDYRVKKVRKRLTKQLRHAFEQMNINVPKRPFYSARYTFALHLSEHPNQDLFEIKRALGHQSIVTTEKYIRRLNLTSLDDYVDTVIIKK